MTTNQPLPNLLDLAWPTVQAMRQLGGSGRIDQICETVADSEGFTDDQLAPVNSRGRSQIFYRIDWVRSVLKRMGAADNSTRGVWSLTRLGWELSEESCRARVEEELAAYRKSRRTIIEADSTIEPVGDLSDEAEPQETDEDWQTALLSRVAMLTPNAFERLSQRLLLEAGFQNVEVMGRSGDGGIDGIGVYKMSLVSFPVYFQCKRYKGTVPVSMVRDFRGALDGRGERGLMITTGDFGKGARDEAVRQGATPIDLVDGTALCDLLKEYGMGVKVTTRTVEDVEIVASFFDQF